MELRWYWRILQRQARVIWTTVAIVAVLSLLFTVYTYIGSRYKTAATVEFSQEQPIFNTQSSFVDPVAAAEANGGTAAGDAKLYSEGDAFFKGISAYMLRVYHKKVDYRNIKVGVTQVGGRQLKIDYSASNSTDATRYVNGAIYQLENGFLPSYEVTFQQKSAPAGFKQNVYEPPITMSIFDPVNTRTVSLLSTLLNWVLKAVLGFVLGIGLAFLWEYLDVSIQDDQDVRNWMHAPVLGLIPGGKQRVA